MLYTFLSLKKMPSYCLIIILVRTLHRELLFFKQILRGKVIVQAYNLSIWETDRRIRNLRLVWLIYDHVSKKKYCAFRDVLNNCFYPNILLVKTLGYLKKFRLILAEIIKTFK